MPLQKQAVDISFAQGLDLKSDPFRIAPGKFLSLNNSVFDKAGELQKRNGYSLLASLPDTTSKYITTFSGNLTAIGNKLEALSIGTSQWVNKGAVMPVSLQTLPLIRSNTNQTQADSVTASNGLICTVYTDQIPNGGSNVATPKYAVADSVTGQNVVAPTVLVGADATYGAPRVFIVGNYFVVAYIVHPSAYNVNYIAISIANPTIVTSPAALITAITPFSTVAWDAVAISGSLIFAWNNTASAQSVKVNSINVTSLSQGSAAGSGTIKTFAGRYAEMFSICIDLYSPSNPVIYVSFYATSQTEAWTLAVFVNLSTALAPTKVIASGAYLNLASTAYNGVCTIYAEKSNNYGYDSGVPTHFIDQRTLTLAGSVGSTTVVVRSVGLASKAFLYQNATYFLAIYSSPYQPTYFLIKGSTGQVIAKLAYSNGPGYYTSGLPFADVSSDTMKVSYLFKDLVQAVAKTGNTATTPVYSQTGVNLLTLNMNPPQIVTSEIGANLNVSGGFVTAYDGYSPVEQEFFLWPDSVETGPHTTGGSMADQTYFYQVTYEWSDNQGNIFRSAPSIPVTAVVSGGSGSGSVTVNVPTLRLTYKTANPVKVVIYRWSTAVQTYYQVTSVTVPTMNNLTSDSIQFVDTLADASITGNNIIYTAGGVIENIGPPATDNIALFDTRLWLIDAEDRNLLWFSKQVIEATPVEMSDLLTLYVPPTTASEGSTGPMTAIAPMDDKLVVFKANAMGYINGTGPDNTGANNGYSNFILINSVVGCTNQNSIVFTPQGLMFQTNKGIWLLGRDLGSHYIGAPVETLTQGATVQSAVNVPSTNQVRFTLDTGITLLYDYYYGQWGTFTNIPAVSSTIYQNLHTYINSFGQTLQESIGSYLDNTSPVLMSFTTGWMNLAGLQGYERFYQMLMLGTYISPFKLNVQVAYDYNSSAIQSTIATPVAPTPAWGGDAVWGGSSPWGGASHVFQVRILPTKQKCESFQISVSEQYDPSFGIQAGAGLTLSGLGLTVGIKKGSRNSAASRSFGK